MGGGCILNSWPTPSGTELASALTMFGARANLTGVDSLFPGSLDFQVVFHKTLEALGAFRGCLEAELGFEPRPNYCRNLCSFLLAQDAGHPMVWPHPKGSGPLQAGQFILCFLNMPFPARGRGCNVCEKNV